MNGKPLKRVIVGSATGARVPALDDSVRYVNYADVQDMSTIEHGPYPQIVIDEANEDLETFANFLKGEGIEVVRPQPVSPVHYYDYCPRGHSFCAWRKCHCNTYAYQSQRI